MRNLIALCVGLLAATATVSAEERVTFDSARYLVGSLQQKLARERGEPIKRPPPETIQGYLSKPTVPAHSRRWWTFMVAAG